VAVPAKATELDACEFFVLLQIPSFPVVDEHAVWLESSTRTFAEEILEAGDTEDSPAVRAVPVRPDFLRRSVFASNKSVRIGVARLSIPLPLAARQVTRNASGHLAGFFEQRWLAH